MARELNAMPNIAIALNNISIMVSAQGDFSAAHRLFAESLTLRMELNDHLGIAVLLSAMAEMAAAEGNMVRSVCLAAATETLLPSIHGALQPDERTQQHKTIATVVIQPL